MKSKRGITLISLTIYVIALTFVIAILASVTTFFYKNVNDTQEDINPLIEFTNFNSYFSQDINNENIRIQNLGQDTIEGRNYEYIILNNINLENEDSNKYIRYIYVENDKAIYRDIDEDTEGSKSTINVCKGVTNCDFSQAEEDNKIRITINIEIEGKEQEYTYTLNN